MERLLERTVPKIAHESWCGKLVSHQTAPKNRWNHPCRAKKLRVEEQGCYGHCDEAILDEDCYWEDWERATWSLTSSWSSFQTSTGTVGRIPEAQLENHFRVFCLDWLHRRSILTFLAQTWLYRNFLPGSSAYQAQQTSIWQQLYPEITICQKGPQHD